MADQLEKLASLRDRGILTEAEFLEQKSALLKQGAGDRPSPATPRDESWWTSSKA